MPISSYFYDRNNAAQYALTFSSNSDGSASYNNGEYRYNKKDGTQTPYSDCASFVSQCLHAGNMPMHKTWRYCLPNGTFHNWTTAWNGTVSLKNMLENRDWATRVSDKNQLLRGDIVYTYVNENDMPHVVMVSKDVASNNGTIYVCGHTTNQRDVPRNTSINSVYYHIHDWLPTQTGDWRLDGLFSDDD
jgi:hypothetical protein